MVLHHRRNDDTSRLKLKSCGKLIDTFGCVLAKKDDIGVEIRTDKLTGDGVSLLVHAGCNNGFEAESPMNSRVPWHELLDASQHAPECRGARGVVKKNIPPSGAVQQRNPCLESHDIAAKVGTCTGDIFFRC